MYPRADVAGVKRSECYFKFMYGLDFVRPSVNKGNSKPCRVGIEKQPGPFDLPYSCEV